MRKLVLINLYVFIFWLVCLSFSNFNISLFRYLRSFSSLAFVLVLAGLNLAAICQFFYTKRFSKIEIISIASIFALFIAPLLIFIEYEFLGLFSPSIPFLNSFAIFILLLAIYSRRKETDLDNFNLLNFKNINVLEVIKSPLLIVFFVYLVSIIAVFFSYYALPELDPYYWYLNFKDSLDHKAIASLLSYRPLFMSFVYILNQAAGIDLYAIFKYVFPLLTFLIILPAWLFAQNFKNHLKQFIVLLIPFINASAFLYSQMSIPQAMLNITVSYAILFLLYSWISQQTFFYFLSGGILLLAYFYHESAILMFLIWCAIALIFYRKSIIKTARKNIFISISLITSIILNIIAFGKGPFEFICFNFNKITFLGNRLGFNLLFPAKYINIDGNDMGWDNFYGVVKYYAYYAGPVFAITIIYFLYLLIHYYDFRNNIKKSVFTKEIGTLLLIFIMFFSISEIFPRLLNIALLPERAWIFGGFFSTVFLFLIMRYQKNNLIFYFLILVSFFINISGALYINNLKKYIVTQANMDSINWVKDNLPENRIIFSNKNYNIIRIFSGSMVMDVPDEFYSNLDSYQKIYNQFKLGDGGLIENYKTIAKNIAENDSKLHTYNIMNQKNEINAVLEENKTLSKRISKLLSISNPSSENVQDIFIYYSGENKKNPYLNRPYYKKEISSNKEFFIFNKYPEKFQKVYSDNENKIYIWKIL